jgi:four helix bundle protein
MNVALKEATESAYWIDLLHETHFLNDKEFDSLYDECSKIIGVLTKIVKATKQ